MNHDRPAVSSRHLLCVSVTYPVNRQVPAAFWLHRLSVARGPSIGLHSSLYRDSEAFESNQNSSLYLYVLFT